VLAGVPTRPTEALRQSATEVLRAAIEHLEEGKTFDPQITLGSELLEGFDRQ
jgi:hypothetical protein